MRTYVVVIHSQTSNEIVRVAKSSLEQSYSDHRCIDPTNNNRMNRSCLSSVRGASSPVVMVTPPPHSFQYAQGPALSNVLSAIVYSLGLLLPSGSRPTLLLPVLCLSLFSGVCLFYRQTVTVVAMTGYNIIGFEMFLMIR